MKPRMLDLFCGAGGAAMGYHRAGFDVVGVDVKPQPRYPFEFHQADALMYLADADLDRFDAIHASPPCRDHSVLSALRGKAGTGWLLAATRQALIPTGLPWVIENVPGAPLRPDWVLCGCLFLLPGLRRQRWFETNWSGVQMQSPCNHSDVEDAVTVAGHPGGRSTRDAVQRADLAAWKRAMDIDWMSARELAQAIPPAYTKHIGDLLINSLAAEAADDEWHEASWSSA